MTIPEFYQQIGVNYDDVLRRMGKEERIRKYLYKMKDDETFGQLKKSFAAGDYESAFRAAHSLKGICLNLALDPVTGSAVALTEALRSDPIALEAPQLLACVEADYEKLMELLDKLTD